MTRLGNLVVQPLGKRFLEGLHHRSQFARERLHQRSCSPSQQMGLHFAACLAFTMHDSIRSYAAIQYKENRKKEEGKTPQQDERASMSSSSSHRSKVGLAKVCRDSKGAWCQAWLVVSASRTSLRASQPTSSSLSSGWRVVRRCNHMPGMTAMREKAFHGHLRIS